MPIKNNQGSDNIPQLRFPEFQGDWEKKKLGEVAEKINSGKTPLGGESVYTESGILFIRSQNVTDDKLSFENSTYISEEINSTMKNSVVKANDILLNITGASLGRSCVVPNNFTIGNVNQHVCIIRLNKENNPRFVQPILSSTKGQNIFVSLQTGSGREGLNFESIKGIEISFPTLPEQTKISSFLTAVDEKIQALKKKHSLLEQYKKGVMQKLFSQEIRFKDKKGNDFPDWEVKKLGEIGTFQTSSIDKLSKENEKEVFLVNYMNVYRHENINNETVKSFQIVTAKDNQIESCNLKRGDILFTPSSETPDDIGHSVVIFEDLENAVFSYHLMRFRPTIEIDILYSHYFCNISSVLKQLTKLATGSTRFTISVNSFSSVEIQLPCLEEQTAIANFLSAIDEKINQTQMQIEKMEVWKKGLLQKMFC
mgnify:CR=1 FL=1